MIHQRAWNKYEVALLIEAYTKITFDGEPINETLSLLSNNLRSMELLSGGVIDKTFRNINGMYWQYGFIKLVFEKKNFENRKPPRLFSELVMLYLNDREKFDDILNVAHFMVAKVEGENQNVPSLKTKFIEYYENASYKRYTVSQCVNCIERVSNYAYEHNISRTSFWDIKDVKEFNVIRTTLSASRIFKFSSPSDFRLFEKIGKIYSDFLKQLPIGVSETPHTNTSSTRNETDTAKPNINIEPDKDQHTIEISTIRTEQKEQEVDLIKNHATEQRIDFNKCNNLSYSKPISYSFNFGEKVFVSSWADLYVSLFRKIYLENKSTFTIGQSFNGGKRMDIGYKNYMVAPKLVCDDIYLETNVSASGIIGKIQAICNLCNIDSDIINIEYVQKEHIRYPDSSAQINLKDFSTWMIEEKGLGPITVQGYGSSLCKLDAFALSKGYIPFSLFDMDIAKLKCESERLLERPEFVAYNAEQHNRFSASLRAFIAYKDFCSQNSCDKFSSSMNTHIEELRQILETNFKYGYREDSMIDRLKLNNFADNASLVLPDEKALKKIIANIGVQYNGKFYFISSELSSTINNMFRDMFNTGIQVVYFEMFYEGKHEFFEENGIASPELLRNILEKNDSNFAISRNYVSSLKIHNNEFSLVEKELVRVWGNTLLHSYDELYALLPYIPQEKIRFYLSRSDLFVWNAHEQFVNTDLIIIDDDSKDEILSFVSSQCLKDGYVSINDVPIEGLMNEYYNVSEGAMQQAVFRKILSADYSINGKLISEKGKSADLETMLYNYCTTKDMCSFNEIADYAYSVAGESNRQLVFKAAYGQMVRINKSQFIADKNIAFRVDLIDDAISRFFNREYVVLLDIVSFAMFPLCGYAWNHYLLESYCYRFSKKYSLLTKNFNDKNVGIIVKKDSNLSYNEVLVDALVHSRMNLDIDCAAEYLYSNGYIAKKRLGNMEELVTQAKKTKEEK